MQENWLFEITVWAVPLLFAITFHEAAHGFVAWRLGDPTAKMQGRVTFNPLKHIDPVGTLLIPGMLMLSQAPFVFGYAKPVPVEASRLRRPKTDMIWVAIAGPAVNLLLALVSALLLHLEKWITPEQQPWLFTTLYISVAVNCVLAAFNLLPILPLDGGRVLAGLLPDRLSYSFSRTERYGMLFVILLLILPAMLREVSIDLPLTEYLIGIPADFLRSVIFEIAGIGDNP